MAEKHSLTGLDGQRDIQLIKILWSIRSIHSEEEESFGTKQHRNIMKWKSCSFSACLLLLYSALVCECIFFFCPRRYHPLLPIHTLPVVVHLQPGWRGKGLQSSLGRFKVAKKFLAVPFCESQARITSPFAGQGGIWGEKKKWLEIGGGRGLQRPRALMYFQVETRSWSIRWKTAALVNSGPPRTHVRWRLIPLSASERKCCLLLSLAAAVWIVPNSFLIV